MRLFGHTLLVRRIMITNTVASTVSGPVIADSILLLASVLCGWQFVCLVCLLLPQKTVHIFPATLDRFRSCNVHSEMSFPSASSWSYS